MPRPPVTYESALSVYDLMQQCQDFALPRECGQRCMLPKAKLGTAWLAQPRRQFQVAQVEYQGLHRQSALATSSCEILPTYRF